MPPASPPSFHDLCNHLSRMADYLERLDALAREKQRRIVERDGPGLARLLEEEAEVAEALARAEEERHDLAVRMGLADAPFREWVARAPAELRASLRFHGERLQSLTRSLAAQGVLNERLLQEELAYIEFALQVMAGPHSEDYLYGPPAGGTVRSGAGEGPRAPSSGDRSVFDFKV